MNLTTMTKPATRVRDTAAETMKAFVYRGPGKKALEDHPKPEITAPTDAIVKIVKTTICGTDLHILKGDVPTCQPGRILATRAWVSSTRLGLPSRRSSQEIVCSSRA